KRESSLPPKSGSPLSRGRADIVIAGLARPPSRVGEDLARAVGGINVNPLAHPGGLAMDLGIAGRKAIVCASSRGLGRACAFALAQAGCAVVANGRDGKTLEATAAELRQATGAKVTAAVGDVATPAGQAALLGACPEPDILVNNNGGPPFRDFRELTRQSIID